MQDFGENGGVVVEWAPFRLVPGVSEQELLQASADLQESFLAAQQGFIRRELLRGRDGNWVDLVYWRDAEAASAVMAAVAASPVCQRYFSLMQGASQDDPAAGVLHFSAVRSYEAAAA